MADFDLWSLTWASFDFFHLMESGSKARSSSSHMMIKKFVSTFLQGLVTLIENLDEFPSGGW